VALVSCLRRWALVFGICAASSAAISGDLFVDGQPIQFKVGDRLVPGTTIGGYAIPPGDWHLTYLDTQLNTQITPIRFGVAQLVELNGERLAALLVIRANLMQRDFLGFIRQCGGEHLISHSLTTANGDSCVEVDSVNLGKQGADFPALKFSVRNSMSGGRIYVFDLIVPFEQLGIKGTTSVDWSIANAKLDASRVALLDRAKPWAKQLLVASNLAFGFNPEGSSFDSLPPIASMKHE
jgi:hypothetical protein